MHNASGAPDITPTRSSARGRSRCRLVQWLGIALGTLAALGAALYGYAYFQTPAAIRYPSFDHLHFRIQIIANGTAADFSDAAFQQAMGVDSCTADLTGSPFHFHDSKDQFAHVHWRGTTGGQFLKYYGWNDVGGPPAALGYRFDAFPRLMQVPVLAAALPQLPAGTTMYVYTGTADHYTQRSYADFTQQTFEQFFGKQSSVPAEARASWQDIVFPHASAHGTASHTSHSTPTESPSQETLKKLNNVLGDVVIFAQKEPPTATQIAARFKAMLPLPDSSCSG